MKNIRTFLDLEWVRVAVILILTALVYSNIFGNDFAGDDHDFILGWEATRNVADWPLHFQGETPEGHEGVYRPLRGLMYMAAYQVLGTDVVGYHGLSLLIHMAVVLLVYKLVCGLGQSARVAFLAAVVFAVHPIHVEAITNVTTAFDVAGVIFWLGSVLLFLKFRKQGRRRLYWASVVLAAVAYFWYEMALVLPLLLWLIDVVVLKIKRVERRWQVYLPYWVPVLAYVYVRFIWLAIPARATYQGDSLYHTMLAGIKVIGKYIQLLLVPLGLSINHNLPGGIAAHTLLEINREPILAQRITEPVILGLLILLATIIYAGWKLRRRMPVITVGIGWLFICLLPVMNLFPNASLMHEKYAYVASVGYALIVAYVIGRLWEGSKERWRRVLIGTAIVVMVGGYGYATLVRNADWKNDVVLWEKTAQQSPDNAIVQFQLGSAYRQAGDMEAAKLAFRQAIMLYPNLVEGLNNLGVIAESEGKYEDAKAYYLRALGIRPEEAELHNNLGVVYQREGDYEAAVKAFETALILEPEYEQGRVNLAEAYVGWGDALMKEGNYDQADILYRRALTVIPGFSEAQTRLGD